MRVIVTKNYEESCQAVANEIITQVQKKSDSKLGLATGGTAEQVYPYLVKAYKEGTVDFSQITSVNLDEYIGMDPESPQSYRQYMADRFFDPAGIDKTKTYVPSGLTKAEDEIALFNEKLYAEKMIDLQLLGVGVSGHIGFNEPGEKLTSGVHIEKLDDSTIAANSRFFDSPDDVPKEAITMGIGDIMKAEKIVLIATGENKVPVIKALLTDDEITCKIPATMLKMHRDVTIVIDAELAKAAGYQA